MEHINLYLLKNAVDKNNIQGAKEAIEYYKSVGELEKMINAYNSYCLRVATKNDNVEMINLLISNGAKIGSDEIDGTKEKTLSVKDIATMYCNNTNFRRDIDNLKIFAVTKNGYNIKKNCLHILFYLYSSHLEAE